MKNLDQLQKQIDKQEKLTNALSKKSDRLLKHRKDTKDGSLALIAQQESFIASIIFYALKNTLEQVKKEQNRLNIFSKYL